MDYKECVGRRERRVLIARYREKERMSLGALMRPTACSFIGTARIAVSGVTPLDVNRPDQIESLGSVSDAPSKLYQTKCIVKRIQNSESNL